MRDINCKAHVGTDLTWRIGTDADAEQPGLDGLSENHEGNGEVKRANAGCGNHGDG
ncbi:hypothetical protein D3C84_1291170 [compost metagenome]